MLIHVSVPRAISNLGEKDYYYFSQSLWELWHWTSHSAPNSTTWDCSNLDWKALIRRAPIVLYIFQTAECEPIREGLVTEWTFSTHVWIEIFCGCSVQIGKLQSGCSVLIERFRFVQACLCLVHLFTFPPRILW